MQDLVTVELCPGGLNHAITHDEEGWNRTMTSPFINRYVFPEGEFDCVVSMPSRHCR